MERPDDAAVSYQLDRERGHAASEPASYREFLAPDERMQLLRDTAAATRELQSAYGLPPFPAFDATAMDSEWTRYPGVSEARHDEIERGFRRMTKRPRYRLEHAALTAAHHLPSPLRRPRSQG